jgi:hypothetical protein
MLLFTEFLFVSLFAFGCLFILLSFVIGQTGASDIDTYIKRRNRKRAQRKKARRARRL